jgi:hypothetical protein
VRYGWASSRNVAISRCIYAETRESGRESRVLADGESSTVSACVCARRVSRPIDAR